MKEYIMQVKNAGRSDTWNEKLQVPEGVEPMEAAKAVIDAFNGEERRRSKITKGKYPVEKRELVKIIDETGDRWDTCELFKITNQSTIGTIYKCRKCELYYINYKLDGLDGSTFKCRPELACHECNKLFASVEELVKHEEIGEHQAPKWLPRSDHE